MSINETLKGLKKQMDESFKQCADQSRQEYIKNLPAGAPLPESNRIYGTEYRDKFFKEADEIRSKVFTAIDDERKRLSAAKTEPPTAEAVNAISLMKLTGDITADDVADMMGRYGENYSAYRAIKSIAAEAGVKGVVTEHKYDKMTEGLDYVATRVPSAFSAISYERNGVQPVQTSGFSVIVDGELPE